MNTLRKVFLNLGILVAFVGLSVSSSKAQGRNNISLQVFYDELSYYGDWITHGEYGYVWSPNVGRDFRPYYTNGRWVMTEYGNTWASDFEWGWAPFHYGRWFYDDYDGWLWMPDTEWGPAWVDWRTGGGYYGWAPLAPRISINVSIGPRYYPDFYWVFIPQRYIYYNNYHRYWAPTRNVTIIRNTTIINNIYVNNNVRYVSGPSVRDVRRATRQDVRVHRINDVSRPGASRVDRNSVSVYRPQVDRSRDAAPGRTVAARPARGTEANRDARPSSGTTNNRVSTESGRPSRRGGEMNRTPQVRSERSERSERATPAARPTTSERNNNAVPGRRETPATSRPVERQQAERPSRPQQVERSREVQRERSSSSPAPQRETRTQSAQPQRVERSAPTRVERPSSAPARSSGAERGSSPSRSSGSGSRPERSGR